MRPVRMLMSAVGLKRPTLLRSLNVIVVQARLTTGLTDP